jgi:hypothetical protein
LLTRRQVYSSCDAPPSSRYIIIWYPKEPNALLKGATLSWKQLQQSSNQKVILQKHKTVYTRYNFKRNLPLLVVWVILSLCRYLYWWCEWYFWNSSVNFDMKISRF